jgi:hypothetical protein
MPQSWEIVPLLAVVVVACEWPFARVAPLVLDQGRLLVKAFVARVEAAVERLGPACVTYRSGANGGKNGGGV